MRAMAAKLLGVPFARYTNHQPEVTVTPCLNSRDGIFNDDCACRVNTELLCRREECIWGGLARQVLRMDCVAIDLYVEEVIQFGGF